MQPLLLPQMLDDPKENYTHTHNYGTAILSYLSSNWLVNMSMFSDLITEVGKLFQSNGKKEC